MTGQRALTYVCCCMSAVAIMRDESMYIRLELTLAIAVCFLVWRPAVAADISQCEMVANGRAEVVEIPTKLDDGRVVSLKGLLMTLSGVGPFPAVIMLPGGGSLYTPYCHGAIAQQFADWGYASLITASSTAIDASGTRLFEYGFTDQANHARGAARALVGLPKIDHTRLAVWGHSRGGLTAIELATSPRDRDGSFRAIIAAAPHCPAKVTDQHIPLLLVIGTDDVTVSYDICEEFAAKSDTQDGFEFLPLAGAKHLFWLEPEAAKVSAERMRLFLESHLGN